MKEKLLALVEEKGDLPPLPEILINLERKVNDPDCDVMEISGIIESEPVLSGRLIQLSNSVLFGGGRENTEDLNDAVMRLGVKMVLDMAYSLKLPGLFSKPKGFNQLLFWTHSLPGLCGQDLPRGDRICLPLRIDARYRNCCF